MDVGLGSPGMYLLLTGGLGAAAGKALVRRDGPTALAMGIAAVMSGQAAGLSEHMLAVAWTVVAVGLVSAAGAVAVRRLLGARTGFVTALVVTCGVLGAMTTQHRAADGETPLTVGMAMHHEMATLIGG